jgi:hypothetical protein
MHVLLSPGGCNTTVIQDVIVPDFLPPSFTDVNRREASVKSQDASAALGVDVRFLRACCVPAETKHATCACSAFSRTASGLFAPSLNSRVGGPPLHSVIVGMVAILYTPISHIETRNAIVSNGSVPSTGRTVQPDSQCHKVRVPIASACSSAVLPGITLI